MDLNRLATVVLALSLPLAARPAAAEDAPAPPSAEVKYKPGTGFTLVQADNFTLQVTGRLQARHTYTDWDEDRDIPDTSDFTAERARIGVKGTFYKVWSYDIEEEFGKGKTELKKGFISWSRIPEARISMGQFNVKFDRSTYASANKTELVDRSLAARTFGPGRSAMMPMWRPSSRATARTRW